MAIKNIASKTTIRLNGTVQWPLLLLLLLASPNSSANLERGEEIHRVCAQCHGEHAQGGKDGEYPRLAGLPAKYIERELRHFISNTRNMPQMAALIKIRHLQDEDLADIATYLESIELPTTSPRPDDGNGDTTVSLGGINIPRLDGDFQAGKQLYKEECSSCHGRDGRGKRTKQIPMLAGQYSNYLLNQIHAFINGGRIHDDEEPEESIFREYQPKEIHNLLAYLSILDDQ